MSIQELYWIALGCNGVLLLVSAYLVWNGNRLRQQAKEHYDAAQKYEQDAQGRYNQAKAYLAHAEIEYRKMIAARDGNVVPLDRPQPLH